MRLVREKIRAQAAAKRIQPRIRLRQLRPELRQRFPAERRVVPVQRRQRGTVPERLRERVIVFVSSVSHRRHRPFPSIRRGIGRRRCFCLYHSTVFSALPDFFRKKCRRGSLLCGIQSVKKPRRVPPRTAEKMEICFVRRRVRRTKHFTSCKCGICVPAAHKLCAQQGASFFKRETSEAFPV